MLQRFAAKNKRLRKGGGILTGYPQLHYVVRAYDFVYITMGTREYQYPRINIFAHNDLYKKNYSCLNYHALLWLEVLVGLPTPTAYSGTFKVISIKIAEISDAYI